MTTIPGRHLNLHAVAIAATVVLVAAAPLAVRLWPHGEPDRVEKSDDPVSGAIRTGMPTIVEFGSNRCQSCRAMKPILERLARVHGERLNVVDVDLLSTTGRRLIPKYRIQMMPTQVFFDRDGVEVDRHLGPIPGDEILRRLGLVVATPTTHL
jgi:thioredoxin 1